MSTEDKIKELVSSDNPYAQQIGAKIQGIHNALNDGSITSVEAKDLLNDMKVAQELAMGAADLEEKILMQKAFDAIVGVLELII